MITQPLPKLIRYNSIGRSASGWDDELRSILTARKDRDKKLAVSGTRFRRGKICALRFAIPKSSNPRRSMKPPTSRAGQKDSYLSQTEKITASTAITAPRIVKARRLTTTRELLWRSVMPDALMIRNTRARMFAHSRKAEPDPVRAAIPNRSKPVRMPAAPAILINNFRLDLPPRIKTTGRPTARTAMSQLTGSGGLSSGKGAGMRLV